MFVHNFIKIFKKFQEIGPVSLFFRNWTSATRRPIPNDIWQSIGLHLVNINVYAKFYHNSPLSSVIHFFRIWSSAKPRPMLNIILQSLGLDFGIPLSRSCLEMGMQNFIKIYHKVQGIGPVLLFSEFEPRQNLDLSQISFDSLIRYILSISICTQNFITIFFTVLQKGPFSLFQNLELGKASTYKKCHFAIFWARSCQYQCLRKSLSK